MVKQCSYPYLVRPISCKKSNNPNNTISGKHHPLNNNIHGNTLYLEKQNPWPTLSSGKHETGSGKVSSKLFTRTKLEEAKKKTNTTRTAGGGGR
jgi:hypothetical protein